MRNLLAVSEKIVPFMSILYVGGALLVILLNIENFPHAFYSIFRYAFTGKAAVGGFAGATLAACIRWGICRGVYSNDAGTGYTTMVHTVAAVNHPFSKACGESLKPFLIPWLSVISPVLRFYALASGQVPV